MATIIAKVAERIGKNVLSAHLWRREPTPEPTLWKKAAGFSQKAPGFAKKAAGFARNPPPFLLMNVSLHFLDKFDERRHVLDVNLRDVHQWPRCAVEVCIAHRKRHQAVYSAALLRDVQRVVVPAVLV